MNITLEAIEKVMNEAGVDYSTAKEALLNADGDAEKAIKELQPKACELEEDVQKLIDKVKAVVAEGNADRVQILKDDEIVLSVPVNVGIVGGILGITAAPWALIAGAAAAFGLGCKLVVVKKDGTKDEVK
ncbi:MULTISPECIES: DUF4342 domain-containing protein [unclassified Butyrivibrio]|uniref:DUF4342 domain-containing protein n=1 Tax=unclassified Butyrivibrio TaxID=2639466 RepID=UPI00040394CF|nr:MULTISPECIES: DUF4342 domain-containing protein [unclassified Butyrivibrio]